MGSGQVSALPRILRKYKSLTQWFVHKITSEAQVLSSQKTRPRMRLVLLLSILALAFIRAANKSNKSNISVQESSDKEGNVEQISSDEAKTKIVKVTNMFERGENNGKQTNEKSLSRKPNSNNEETRSKSRHKREAKKGNEKGKLKSKG